MIRSSAGARAGVVALVALVVLVAVVSVVQIFYSRSTHSQEIRKGELAAVQLASTAVAGVVEGDLSDITNLASLPCQSGSTSCKPGQSALIDLFSPHPNKTERQMIRQTVSSLHLLYPAFAGFALARTDGSVTGASAVMDGKTITFLSEPFFTKPVRDRTSYVSAAFNQTPGGEVVALSTPVLSGGTNGSVVGVLIGTVRVHILADQVGTHLRSGGQLVIVDQAGHALSGPQPSASHSYTTDPAVAGSLAGRSGTGSGPVPGFTGLRLVGYTPVRGPGLLWGVIVEDPPSLLSNPVRSTTIRLSIIDSLVVLFAIGALIWVARLLRQLEIQRDGATAVFSSVGEGIASLDREGRIRAVNPALESLLGQRGSDLVGKKWSEDVPIFMEGGERVPFEETLVARALQEKAVAATEGYAESVRTAGGDHLPVSVTAAPLRTRGEIDGVVVILRDVSREHEVDQLKSSLISTVSHELRTPLTMIQGFSELLLTRSDLGPAGSRAALEQVHTSSKRLSRLIEDLLSVSRIDAGKMVPELAHLDLGHVVDDALQPFIAQFGRPFVVDIDKDVGQVRADPEMMVNLLTNLVSNAIKYSPAGSTVRVNACKATEHAEVSVADEGIGLTESEIDSVFEKFARADRPEVRRVGGTGLGLYIARRLAEAQGGRLWVTSEVGRGSTFSFSVPLVESPT